MKQKIKSLPIEAKKKEAIFLKTTKKIKKKPPKNFDYIMQEIHEEVFDHIDCLSCANCCKTTSPIITEKDIERISKHLKIKSQHFIEKYLKKDTDNLWMFKETPCVFLDHDNYCLIYEVRPKACREYPHLDRKKNHQLLNLHIKNTSICPAAFEAMEILVKKINYKKK